MTDYTSQTEPRWEKTGRYSHCALDGDWAAWVWDFASHVVSAPDPTRPWLWGVRGRLSFASYVREGWAVSLDEAKNRAARHLRELAAASPPDPEDCLDEDFVNSLPQEET